MGSRIIVALDAMNEKQALALAERLKGVVWGFKVNDLLLDLGLSVIGKLKEYGSVFADPKLHDIPNTVANSVKKLSAAGADLITCHASGGGKMLEAAAKAAGESKILAVTALTSLSADDVQSIYGKKLDETVLGFARSAKAAGVHGVVSSPKELELLHQDEYLHSLIKVTPGIRPQWHVKPDDQSRVTTPKDAISLGASYMVIGRPIIEHADPAEAARLINDEVAQVRRSS